jgi:hypothetical protein
MDKPLDMFDRDAEWDALARFVGDEQGGATLGVVSGRRRQGKTYLLDAACRASGGFYFAAEEATEAETLRYLGAAIASHIDSPAPLRLADWRQAIDALLSLGEGRPTPVVIDEFPYLVKATPALPSIIQAALGPRRAERTRSRARLLLCGSAMSFMGKLLGGNAPLRGRAGLELVVNPLDHRVAARFWDITDPRLAVQVNAVVGGTPAYRREFTRNDTPTDAADFDAWITRTVLSPESPLFREARYLLAEEPELRDTGLYHSVLAAVAVGNTTRGGIAGYLGRKSTDIAHPLHVLEDAALLCREPDVFRDNRTNYRIAEPLIAFYHAVMRPVWAQLERPGNAARVWRNSQRRFVSNVLGPHFERICRSWAMNWGEDGLTGELPARVGSGTVNDAANRTSHEVDVAVVGVADGARPPLLSIGEAKWNEVMGLGHLERLRRIRSLLDGYPRFDTTGTALACYSGAGFTDELRAAGDRGEVVLVDLDMLYG